MSDQSNDNKVCIPPTFAQKMLMKTGQFSGAGLAGNQTLSGPRGEEVFVGTAGLREKSEETGLTLTEAKKVLENKENLKEYCEGGNPFIEAAQNKEDGIPLNRRVSPSVPKP